jgi:hypothetical protein
MMAEPIVFINIGWMKYYQGPSPSDPLEAENFGYFKKANAKTGATVGYEQWNFKDRNGWVYGYVPRSSGINVTRLGASPDQDELKGVLAIFVARDPAAQELKVVGWYRNATVSRTPTYKRRFGKNAIEAPIAARWADCRVLPVASRNIVIPTAKSILGGFGQSPVWYAESHPDVVRHVRRLVSGADVRFRKPSRRKTRTVRGSPRNLDPDTRLAVEMRAMEWAMKYFDDAEDVSRECKGWDVEASSDGADILIEVKGLSGPSVVVELTPNEYKQMQEEKKRYLIFVVTNALTRRARARTFRYCLSGKRRFGKWVSDQGEVLIVQEQVGARVRL